MFNYSFGLNEQEKDDEVFNSSGTSYTAQFWQYDARIGRRWNLDPKPNPAISQYATFACNPIMYSDVLGDTVKVKYGGFLGIGRKSATYNENDKKFYDSKTKDVVSSKNGYFKKVNSAIQKLDSEKEGNSLVNDLGKAEHVFTIKRGTNGYVPINKEKAFKLGEGREVLFFWNPSKNQGFVKLAHEFGHGQDSKQGTCDWKTKLRVPGYNDISINAEKYAVGVENKIRAEHGLKLKKYYIEGIEETKMVK